jgi:predicted PurR-regulated permease PerM
MLFLPMIIEQGTTLFAAVPRYYQNFLEWMITNPNPMLKQLSETLPTTLPGLIPFQQSGQQMLDSVEQVIIYFTSAIEVIFLTAAIFLLIVHWTLDGSQTIQSLLQLAPKNKRENIQELVQAMETKVGFFVAGQGVLCLVIGFLSLIAYLIIGIPDPLVLALVAGILEAIPIIGPILGAVPAALIALSVDPSKLIWVIAASIIIQQLENSILVPRIMRKAVGVNPFVTLLAFFAFSSAFGIAGSLMAIPFAAIIQILLNRFVFYPTEAVPELSDNRDLASRLRYEAQDLASDLRKQARVNKAGSTATIRQIDHTMDEIEAITTDLDALLAQIHPQSSR